MKLTSIIYAGLVAAVSVQAAAPAQTTDINVLSADEDAFINLFEPILLTLSTLDPRYRFHFCYRRGEACAKAKRDALALAEAVADAHASANPEAIAEPNAEADPKKKYRFQFCYRRGEACAKVKRAAAAIAEAIADPTAAADPKYRYHFCYRRGEACAKNKRALEELSSVVDKIQTEYAQEIQD
ncbi:MAG: hypothetical protein LQ339_007268 [Xanthoria mediterranea]|nr:MAG: hypothetical protein LQ339_007268 [Xanthoria mediterranea]